ncbi:MAG: hypothetical protein KAX49_19890, partial [Halanaerobiales bacterium]|nr:hypothetical protein [Halanaerobiales bacterium]
MSKRLYFIWMLFLCLLFICVNPTLAKKEVGLPVFNEKEMKELQQQGFEWDYLVEASLVAYDFNLPLKTVVNLSSEGYSWKEIKKALAEMKNAREIIKDEEKLSHNQILSFLVNEGFSEKEIAMIVYFGVLNKKDLDYLAKEALKEKKEKTKKSDEEDNFLQTIDLDVSPDYQTSSTSAVSFYDPGYGYDAFKSSPFATIMKNGNEVINPATGFLKITETDLSLPGKNGLNLNLTRVYCSEKAELDKIDANFVTYKPEEYIVINYTYGGNYSEKLYNLGVGWGFDFPVLEEGKYLHFGSGQTYKIDWNNVKTGLKDIDIKEFILEQYSNSNYPFAHYRLKHKTGINYYFDSEGKLIKIQNRYGDTISLTWINIDDRVYLDKIVDSVNRIITFSYTDELITVTLESDTDNKPYIIKYYKESIGDNHYKLSNVELPEQVNKSYSYYKGETEFGFWVDDNWNENKTANRYYLFLTNVYNPYGGESVFTYERNYKRELDSHGGYEYFHKVTGRCDLVNGQKQNDRKYEYHDDFWGVTYQTDIYYYGNRNITNYARKEILYFNKDYQNEKTEIYLTNKPNYKEERTTFYDGEKPELITIKKTDFFTGELTKKVIDVEYDQYGTLIYQEDGEGRVIESYYDIKSREDTDTRFQVLNLTRKSMNSVGTGSAEYVGESYIYDSYGNVKLIKEKEYYNGYYELTTEDFSGPLGATLIQTGDKFIKEISKGSQRVDFNIFYYIDSWFKALNYEVRFWAVGEPRPENYYINFPRSSLFGSYYDNDTFSIEIPDPTKSYYIEIEIKNLSGDSYIWLQDLDVTYDKLNFANNEIKKITYNHYANPAFSGLPNIVHKEYGNSSTHDITFESDNCIITEYEYSHLGVDDIVTGENYDNIFPTKITQHVTDVDGVSKSIVTDLRYNRFGHITGIDTYPSENILESKRYSYDGINRLKTENYERKVPAVEGQINKSYDYSTSSDENGFFITTICYQDSFGNNLDQQTTSFYYDGLGQQVESWAGPEAQAILVEKIGYDEFGRKDFVEDGNNIRTEFDYDGFSRPKEIRFADGTKKVIDYNDAGRKVTEK